MFRPLSTQLVGSYAKPIWLARHSHMMMYDHLWWRPEPEVLQSAGDNPDAKVEVSIPVPRIVEKITWPGPMSLDAVKFLKQHTAKPVKANVVGALTAAYYLKDEHYHDDRAEALDLAAALNEELRAIDTEGVDLLQIDEPVFHYHISRARRYGVEVMNRMVEGLRTPVIVHVCYGYAALIEGKSVNPADAEVLSLLAQCNIWGISLEYEEPAHQPEVLQYCGDKHVILGLLNLGTERVETAEYIVSRLRAALEVVPAERLHPAPDCGMWHLPRETAFAKLRSLVLGTEMVRRELGLMRGSSSLTARDEQ